MSKAIIFSAPSGAGKTTLVKYLLSLDLDLTFSISATSREARYNELDGKDYYFLKPEEFEARIARKEFVEWEEVYSGTKYGTLTQEVERVWALGKHLIFDVDVEGGINLKKHFGDKALSIFVMPPSVKVLRERLESRGTESEESLEKRVAKAASELTRADAFDVVVENFELEMALRKAEELVKNFLNS